jgi:hypothetical protein
MLFGLSNVLIQLLATQEFDEFLMGDGFPNFQVAYQIVACIGCMGTIAAAVDDYNAADEELFEYQPQDEPVAHYAPPAYRRIADFLDDDDARRLTRFTIPQLQELNNIFQLPEHVEVKDYHFHREELLIFSLAKIASGLANVELCDNVFGGAEDRWSYGYPHFLRYLDQRYFLINSFLGLARWLQMFPSFSACIKRKLEDRGLVRGNDYECLIFGWIDGSIFETCTPETGPDGDYVDAPRKANAYWHQRALFTRYKHLHGVKMLTILLPNGISFIWGPFSARPHDAAVLGWSQLNTMLNRLQNGLFPGGLRYCVFGDRGFPYNGGCIRSHYGVNDPRVGDNAALSAARISIECWYGFFADTFRVCSTFAPWKLREEHPHVNEQLRVAHLLANIYTCYNHNNCSNSMLGSRFVPTAQQYLHL